MSPDQNLFMEHIKSGSFRISQGEKWDFAVIQDLISNWPQVVIWVKSCGKDGLKDRYYFRFNLENYPEQAPIATPWDISSNSILMENLWPKGDRISSVFKPSWNMNGLYTPLDRLGLSTHSEWKTQFPELSWKSNYTIITYLNFIYRLFNY